MDKQPTSLFFEIKSQIEEMIVCLLDAYPFFKKNRLYRGLLEKKWIIIFAIVVSILFSIRLINSILLFIGVKQPADNNFSLELSEMGVMESAKLISEKVLFNGTPTYLLIILLEVIIFHVAVKTLSIVNNQILQPSFKDFLTAEKRMIKVMVRNFFKGAIISIILQVPISILDLEYLEDFIMFLVYSYYVGFAFLDNYNEQFDKTIKESNDIIKEHRWASTFLGVIISLLLYIPLLGALITPFLGAIAATLYGNKNNIEGIIMPEEIH